MTLAPEWTKGVHHDGSEVYVSNPLQEHGEEITLWLRAPAGAPVKAAFIRTEPDGEQHEEPMVLGYQDATNRWYRGSSRRNSSVRHIGSDLGRSLGSAIASASAMPSIPTM